MKYYDLLQKNTGPRILMFHKYGTSLLTYMRYRYLYKLLYDIGGWVTVFSPVESDLIPATVSTKSYRHQ
jgi:hypothetical protein